MYLYQSFDSVNLECVPCDIYFLFDICTSLNLVRKIYCENERRLIKFSLNTILRSFSVYQSGVEISLSCSLSLFLRNGR